MKFNCQYPVILTYRRFGETRGCRRWYWVAVYAGACNTPLPARSLPWDSATVTTVRSSREVHSLLQPGSPMTVWNGVRERNISLDMSQVRAYSAAFVAIAGRAWSVSPLITIWQGFTQEPLTVTTDSRHRFTSIPAVKRPGTRFRTIYPSSRPNDVRLIPSKKN